MSLAPSTSLLVLLIPWTPTPNGKIAVLCYLPLHVLKIRALSSSLAYLTPDAAFAPVTAGVPVRAYPTTSKLLAGAPHCAVPPEPGRAAGSKLGSGKQAKRLGVPGSWCGLACARSRVEAPVNCMPRRPTWHGALPTPAPPL